MKAAMKVVNEAQNHGSGNRESESYCNAIPLGFSIDPEPYSSPIQESWTQTKIATDERPTTEMFIAWTTSNHQCRLGIQALELRFGASKQRDIAASPAL